MLWFYSVGGVVAVLISWRFLVVNAFFDLKMAGSMVDWIKALFYQFFRTGMLSCCAFFLSWIAVGFLIVYYNDLLNELNRFKG